MLPLECEWMKDVEEESTRLFGDLALVGREIAKESVTTVTRRRYSLLLDFSFLLAFLLLFLYSSPLSFRGYMRSRVTGCNGVSVRGFIRKLLQSVE